MPEGGKVLALFIKLHRSEPMAEASTLTLRSGLGIVGNAGPSGCTPRQVTIGIASSLAAKGVSYTGARCNIVLDRNEAGLNAGSLLIINGVVLRITMACEPCTHGAKMAGVAMPRFREIERYLATVVSGGELGVGSTSSIQLDVFPSAPGDFLTRCAWALDFVPTGGVVGAADFLDAIGAGPSYARAFPRWMSVAKSEGKPVHRVLTSTLEAPSWCPDALDVLRAEGITQPSQSRFDLMQALWF